MPEMTWPIGAKFKTTVVFSDAGETTARVLGNNAAWLCICGREPMPLLATQFPPSRVTVCPSCRRAYRFSKDSGHVERVDLPTHDALSPCKQAPKKNAAKKK